MAASQAARDAQSSSQSPDPLANYRDYSNAVSRIALGFYDQWYELTTSGPTERTYGTETLEKWGVPDALQPGLAGFAQAASEVGQLPSKLLDNTQEIGMAGLKATHDEVAKGLYEAGLISEAEQMNYERFQSQFANEAAVRLVALALFARGSSIVSKEAAGAYFSQVDREAIKAYLLQKFPQTAGFSLGMAAVETLESPGKETWAEIAEKILLSFFTQVAARGSFKLFPELLADTGDTLSDTEEGSQTAIDNKAEAKDRLVSAETSRAASNLIKAQGELKFYYSKLDEKIAQNPNYLATEAGQKVTQHLALKENQIDAYEKQLADKMAKDFADNEHTITPEKQAAWIKACLIFLDAITSGPGGV